MVCSGVPGTCRGRPNDHTERLAMTVAPLAAAFGLAIGLFAVLSYVASGR